jgi:hypothetical protein
MPSLPPRNVTGDRLGNMLRIYLHAHQVKDSWCVQYLEADLKTSVGRMYDYSSLDRVREILTRASADGEARETFESGIRRWGIGACFLTLTAEQYKKLRDSRTTPVPKLKR